MKTVILSLILVFVVVFSVGVYSAGDSTGANSDDDSVECSVREDCPVGDYDESKSCGLYYSCIEGKCQGVVIECPIVQDSVREDGAIALRPDANSIAKTRIRKANVVADRIRAKNAAAIEQRRDRAAQLKDAYADADCESFDERGERIRCRLVHGEYRAPAGTVPEACKQLDDREKCQKLYTALRTCYSKEGREKDACFKRVVGFVRGNLADEDSDGRGEKARNYVVALLYDLQERVEYAVEEGKIDPDDGVEIVDKIVEIKEMILNGEPRDEVKAEMRELRQMWLDAQIVEEDSEDE